MIFVIDTSSSIAALATIDGELRTELLLPARSPELHAALSRIARSGGITKVAVATGPGSFTGLRVGVAFGLGLAMGLGVPIVPLGTLPLQAARSDEPVTAIVEAGRGRYYYLAPDGKPALGAPADIPSDRALVGNVSNAAPLLAAGHLFKPESELRPFVDAAQNLIETASEVPYRSLEIEYMQFFSAKS